MTLCERNASLEGSFSLDDEMNLDIKLCQHVDQVWLVVSLSSSIKSKSQNVKECQRVGHS